MATKRTSKATIKAQNTATTELDAELDELLNQLDQEASMTTTQTTQPQDQQTTKGIDFFKISQSSKEGGNHYDHDSIGHHEHSTAEPGIYCPCYYYHHTHRGGFYDHPNHSTPEPAAEPATRFPSW